MVWREISKKAWLHEVRPTLLSHLNSKKLRTLVDDYRIVRLCVSTSWATHIPVTFNVEQNLPRLVYKNCDLVGLHVAIVVDLSSTHYFITSYSVICLYRACVSVDTRSPANHDLLSQKGWMFSLSDKNLFGWASCLHSDWPTHYFITSYSVICLYRVCVSVYTRSPDNYIWATMAVNPCHAEIICWNLAGLHVSIAVGI